MIDYDRFLEFLKNRRSIRRFKPEPVPDEYIDKIIEASRWAPSAGNSQPWEFVVIKDSAVRNKIVEIFQEQNQIVAKMELTRKPEFRLNVHHLDTPGFAIAPVFIIPYGDIRTKEAYPLDANLCRGNSNFYSSLANAFIYMALAANTFGLGSQWVSCLTHPYPQSLIRELLNVPDELEMYDMMVLGFPDAIPKTRVVRPRQEMTHYNSIDKARLRTEQQVKDFIVSLRRV